MVVLHVVLSSILVCTLLASQPRNTFNSGYILFSKDCGSFSKCIFLWRKISNFWRIFDGSRVLVCMLVSRSNRWAWPEFHTPGRIHLWRWRGVSSSHSPGALMLPCPKHPWCHHAIRSASRSGANVQILKGNSSTPKTGLQHDFCWMSMCHANVMRCQWHCHQCHVSHQPVLCPARRHRGQYWGIHSNVARYLDKPGLNMIPACCAATWPHHFWGHQVMMETVRDGRGSSWPVMPGTAYCEGFTMIKWMKEW